MTNQQNDDLTAWLSEKFPVLSKNDVCLIVMHIDRYFLPSVKEAAFDDETPDHTIGNEDGI